MSALSEALKVGGAGLTQFGTAKMQEEMQARRDAAMTRREENLARLRAQLQSTAAGEAREFQAEEAEKGREFKREMTGQAQTFTTEEREGKQGFEAAESEKERQSREKIAGIKAEAKTKPTAAGSRQEKNRLQRERKQAASQLRSHKEWGVLKPEDQVAAQARVDDLINNEDKTAGQAIEIVNAQLYNRTKIIDAYMAMLAKSEDEKLRKLNREDVVQLLIKKKKLIY